MQFKKVISAALVVILLLSLTVFSASASAASVFELAVEVNSTADEENSFIKAGETIEVNIAIPEGKNPGVAYMAFDVYYNPESLDLDENSVTTAIFTMGSPELNRAGVIIDEEFGRIAFKTDMRNASNIVETGVVATLSFKVLAECTEETIEVWNLLAVNASSDIVETVEGSAEVVVHSFKETEKVGATCTEDGYTSYKCEKCDATYDVAGDKALGHDFSKATCTEDSACTRCELAGDKATGHSYSAWTVDKEAAEGVEGSKSRTCSNCGNKETEKIPALAIQDPIDDESSFPVAAVVIIVVVVVAAAGFCVYWFVLKKK